MTQEEEREGFEEETNKESLAAMNLEDTLKLVNDGDRRSLYEGKEDEQE